MGHCRGVWIFRKQSDVNTPRGGRKNKKNTNVAGLVVGLGPGQNVYLEIFETKLPLRVTRQK